jgi:serine/threonine-protein kinase HipA
MVIYAPASTRDAKSLSSAVRRGRLRRLATGIYADDLERPADEIVRHHLLAILGTAYPDCYVSHSTAALLGPREGSAFISGSPTRRAVDLPGLTVHRLGGLDEPEARWLELDTLVANSLSAEPRPARVRISTPLQTVFEVLSTDARQPHRSLPDETVRSLINDLGRVDRIRAERFARRHGFNREYERYKVLAADLAAGYTVAPTGPEGLDVFFYDWRVGRLERLSGGEFRFRYAEAWTTPLTSHLPTNHEGPAYEGPGLPPFFENLLPEGWAEARLHAVHRIAGEDVFGLLKTTAKYPGNLTLRPDELDATVMEYDRLGLHLERIAPDPGQRLPVREALGEDPETRALWLELKRRGAPRLSGVQRKLPVHLAADPSNPTGFVLTLAGLVVPGSHILKFQGFDQPDLVQNEWATMELARRAGLEVASVRQVTFQADSRFRTPGLLVERFDVPAVDEPEQISILEDAASVLALRRADKYRTSMERIQDALADEGLASAGLLRFVELAAFSWLVGNGDLHAKNVSILRDFRPGKLGSAPEPIGVRLSPAYDLVNTAVVIRGDLFALPVGGRENNLRRRDFLALAARVDLSRSTVDARLDRVARSVEANLDEVLAGAELPKGALEAYREIVTSRLAAF